MIKGIRGVLTAAALASAISFAAAPVPALADRNAPPDETVRDDSRIDRVEQELKRMRDEKAAAERKKAEDARKAAEAKKREQARRAEAEKRRRAAAQKKAAEKALADQLNQGMDFIEDGRYQDGLTVLRAYVRSNSNSPDAWYWIARAHNALGDYDRAQAAANIALELDPYYPPLTKSPSGLEPVPYRGKRERREPRPSMSVLPVRPTLPANLALEPVTISFPVLMRGEVVGAEEDIDGEQREWYEMRHYEGRDPVRGARLDYRPYPPTPRGRTLAWMQDEAWTEIGRWRFRVDRMGILKDPQVPIAWRGSYPYEVYFWTGSEWARARRNRVYYDHKEAFDDTLAQAQESIRQLLDERGYYWNPSDTPALIASASHMRYMWMGEIDLEPAHKRAEKRAREHFVYDTWDELPADAHGHGHDGGRDHSSPSPGPSSPGPSGPSNPGNDDGGNYY